jgi:hypothetical protein
MLPVGVRIPVRDSEASAAITPISLPMSFGVEQIVFPLWRKRLCPNASRRVVNLF